MSKMLTTEDESEICKKAVTGKNEDELETKENYETSADNIDFKSLIARFMIG